MNGKAAKERAEREDAIAAIFPPGTVVRLHSGGSMMTVSHFVGHDRSLHTDEKIGVHVYWHGDDGKPYVEAYGPDMLIVERRPSGLKPAKAVDTNGTNTGHACS